MNKGEDSGSINQSAVAPKPMDEELAFIKRMDCTWFARYRGLRITESWKVMRGDNPLVSPLTQDELERMQAVVNNRAFRSLNV